VGCLVGIPLVDVVLRVPADPHSAKASWGLRIVSGAFPFCAAFFSFFSMSLTTAFRLRAPLADIIAKLVQLHTTETSTLVTEEKREAGLSH
jgi:CBS domain containing-hemolysin-like protein